MRVAIIGRTELLYDTAVLLLEHGHEISCVLTSKEAAGYKRAASDFEALASRLGVPFACSASIASHIQMLQHSRADVAVSVNYAAVIPEEVIKVFKFGILNAHGGDLPRYRGNACQAWAILNGETRIGLCVHRMVGGELDSGDIITREYMRLTVDTTVTNVWDWMSGAVPKLFLAALELLTLDGSFVLEVQSKDPGNALRCYPRRPEDGRISWGDSALRVLRLINASTKPYAGAYCENEGRRMTVWKASLCDDGERFCAMPGQVTRVGDGVVDVACGEGKLRLISVEVGDEVAAPTKWIKSLRTRLT